MKMLNKIAFESQCTSAQNPAKAIQNSFMFFPQPKELDQSKLLIDDKDIIWLHNWALSNKKLKEFLHEQLLTDYMSVSIYFIYLNYLDFWYRYIYLAFKVFNA